MAEEAKTENVDVQPRVCPTCRQTVPPPPPPKCGECKDSGYTLAMNGTDEQIAWIMTVCNVQESCKAARLAIPKQVTFPWPNQWQPACDRDVNDDAEKPEGWQTDKPASDAEGEAVGVVEKSDGLRQDI